MAAGEQTSSEYIKHHLTNLTYGRDQDGVWRLAETAQEAQEMGFYAIHLDSMGWAIGLGLIFIILFSMVAKRATTGIPGGLQNSVEMIIEFIDSNVKDTFSHTNKLIAPMASYSFYVGSSNESYGFSARRLGATASNFYWLTLFGMDPHHVYFKIVPTTDPNVTMGMSPFSILSCFVF